ncbi:MAG: metal ABC transporter permease [Bacteroidota bacterium]
MSQLLSYSFLSNALLASLFMSITCGIIGTYVVSRRMVFIAGGLTHSSFGGIGIGYYLGFSPIAGAAGFAVLSALGIEYLTNKQRIRNDSAIAMFWAFGMALGIILIYLSPGYAPNLMSYLFGSILTVTGTEVMLLFALSVLILFLFIFFYRSIVYVAFDEDFARSQRIPVDWINNILMILIALTIVLNIRTTGIILVLSMLTIPQNIAGLFVKKFQSIMFYSVGIAFLSSILGLICAYYLNIPGGAAIIFFMTAVFGLLKSMLLIKARKKRWEFAGKI